MLLSDLLGTEKNAAQGFFGAPTPLWEGKRGERGGTSSTPTQQSPCCGRGRSFQAEVAN